MAEEKEIKNAYIFVSDALRWDYLPNSVAKLGVSKQTIAQSTLSPVAFSSMVTGQYPASHGVYTFSNSINTEQSLFEIEGHDVSIWQDHESSAILSVLGQEPKKSDSIGLQSVSQPFIHIERELSSHAPYRSDPNSENWVEYDALTYLNRESSDLSSLRQLYKKGAETAAKRFHDRLEYLRQSGLLDETLVIFTADHGELLGEYTEFSHTFPMVPELVRVPTVFIHPDNRSIERSLLSQVDIVPTIADVLNLNLDYPIDGRSAYAPGGSDYGISQLYLPAGSSARGPVNSWSMNLLHRGSYNIDSVWDTTGGWVFNNSSISANFSYLLQSLLPSKRKRNCLRQNPKELTKLVESVSKKVVKYRKPQLTIDDAQSIIDDLKTPQEYKNKSMSLSEDQANHLEDLGYL